MNTNNDIEKIKAEEKVKVLTLLLLFFVLLGGVWEYQKSHSSLDSIIVVYKSSNEEIGEEKRVVDNNVVENVKEERQEDNAKSQSEEQSLGDNSQILNEFFQYMDDVKNSLEEIEKPVLVLDKIIQVEEVVKEKAEVNPFEEGKLEIYDTEKGIVKIEEVKNEEIESAKSIVVDKKIEAEVVNELVEDADSDVENNESLHVEDIESQVFENNKEKIDEEDVVSSDGTIDMMKNIIKRNE